MYKIPEQITAGITQVISLTLTAYQAPEFTVSLILRGPQSIDIVAESDGPTHTLKFSAAETKNYPAGVYAYSLRASDGVDVFEIEAGRLRIVGDLSLVAGASDARDHVEKVLAAIEAVIEGRASLDQESYKINNRELRRTPISDLLALRSHYRDEMRRIGAAKKGQSILGRPILVRF